MGEEPVEALGAPLKRQIVELDEIGGGGRGGEIEEATAAFGDEIGAGGIGEDEDGAELRLDPPCGTVDDDALPLLKLEPVVIGSLRRRLGIADHARRERKGLSRGRVGRGAERLRVRSDREHTRRRYAQCRHHPGIVEPRRHVSGDGHQESILLRLSLGREDGRGGDAGMGEEELRSDRLAASLPPVEELARHLHFDRRRLLPLPRLLGACRHEREQAWQRQADRLGAEIGTEDGRHRQGEGADADPAAIDRVKRAWVGHRESPAPRGGPWMMFSD